MLDLKKKKLKRVGGGGEKEILRFSKNNPWKRDFLFKIFIKHERDMEVKRKCKSQAENFVFSILERFWSCKIYYEILDLGLWFR